MNQYKTMLGVVVIYAASAALWYAHATNAFASMRYQLLELTASGEAAVADVYVHMTSQTQVWVSSIERAWAAAVKAGLEAISELPAYPLIKRLYPDVYAFDVACLNTNPKWYVLNYVGVGSPITGLNRAEVEKNWGKLRKDSPAGYDLDEFPFASTFEGGQPAIGHMTPSSENRRQGGLLGLFYRWRMRGAAGRFAVIPIDL